MTMADVREYEKRLQKETNEKVLQLEDDDGKEVFEDAIEGGDAY